MSLQVFLQARLVGLEEFLAFRSLDLPEHNADFIGRCAWLSLYCEVLPRALLADLKLSRMLLGSSSAEQFLLVLAEDDIGRANEFLSRAAEGVAKVSGARLRLVWASTEDLGAWPVVRKRIDDALIAQISAPIANEADSLRRFAPFTGTAIVDNDSYFVAFGHGLPLASRVGWSPEHPEYLSWDGGQYSWALKDQSGNEDEAILFPRRFAMDESGTQPSDPAELAQRADGAHRWGVLRGDVDQFDLRLRRVGSIEEHIHLSVLLKEFFAGELSVICTLPAFWRKVTILYRGGDDFALLGTWDALVLLAREMQRLFEKFAEQNFQTLPGLEGKTITMALAIAPEIDSTVAQLFDEAGAQLQRAKSTEMGTFHIFGRALEWKRLGEAEELKSGLLRLVREFGYSPDYINDLVAVYREFSAARSDRSGSGKSVRLERPWRTYMRVSRVIPQSRERELNNLRNALITNLVGRKTGNFKLRPSARVGLEWARLASVS